MSVSPYLDREARLVELGAALTRIHPSRDVDDRAVRMFAYVTSGLQPPSDANDVEVLRRYRLFRQLARPHVAEAAA